MNCFVDVNGWVFCIIMRFWRNDIGVNVWSVPIGKRRGAAWLGTGIPPARDNVLTPFIIHNSICMDIELRRPQNMESTGKMESPKSIDGSRADPTSQYIRAA